MADIKIPGFRGVYTISACGKVSRTINGKKIYLSVFKGRYLQVSLSKNKKQRPYLLHRLLAITFIENKNKYPQVNHKDGNKLNNSLDNLEWCTSQQNIIHAFKSGLRPNSSGRRHHAARRIKCVSTGKIYDTLSEAAKDLGTDTNSVWRVCAGLRKTLKSRVLVYEKQQRDIYGY